MTVDNSSAAAAMDILRGFGRRNEAALEQLAAFTDWPRIARAELERRATSIVQTFDDETLRAIADGTVDFSALCRDVAAELAPKAAPD